MDAYNSFYLQAMTDKQRNVITCKSQKRKQKVLQGRNEAVDRAGVFSCASNSPAVSAPSSSEPHQQEPSQCSYICDTKVTTPYKTPFMFSIAQAIFNVLFLSCILYRVLVTMATLTAI